MHPFAVLVLLLTNLSSPITARRFTKDKDAVRLSDIKALTFYKDRETTHRRVEALPQLTCTAGSGCNYFEPDSIRCTNSGSSYDESSIEWTCKASLPPEFKLGATEVICEGYDNSDDPLVLKGSCALEYRLLLTDVGMERFGKSGGRADTNQDGDGNDTGAFLAGAIFWVIFAGIAGWILYSLWKGIFRPDGNPPAPRDDQRRGWRGGWDDDDDDAPPPPYTPYRDNNATAAQYAKPKSAKQSTSQPRSSRASSSRSQPQQNQQRPWWQPFGAGAAAGGAAAYMAGNMMNSRRERDLQEREQRLAGAEGQQARRSWFNSMAGSGNQQPARNSGRGNGGFGFGGGGRPSSSFDSGSSSPSFSESRYESTGFGGTRRR